MLKATITPAPLALAGNPVQLSIYSSSVATYNIANIFTGSVDPGNTDIYINEILQEILPVWSFDKITDEQKTKLIIPAAISQLYTVDISNTEGDKLTLQSTILPGGVSKNTLRALLADNNNIFNFKLLNPSSNLFMTARSTGQFITMRETEFVPLLFLHPGGVIRVESRGISIAIPSAEERKPYALNFPAIREKIFNEYNRLINRFDIYFDQNYAATILITPGAITEARYILEFKNSYGVYERIEVSGTGSLEPESDEDNIVAEYDPEINDYVEKRDRRASRDILQIETGYKTQEELIFLIDMLSSDDIRLLGYREHPIRCTASAEDLSLALTSREPVSLHIALRFVDKDSHFTGDVPLDFDDNRIHVDQFSQQFN